MTPERTGTGGGTGVEPGSGTGVALATEEARLPRELVRASAGTGKTFWISSRIVGLLAAGAEPEHVLASTFTRKAAGEILDRVLHRLARAALDPEDARQLGCHARLPGDSRAPEDVLSREEALELLRSLVRRLHRMDVGTLDALFVRMARSYSLELRLPPGWTIADEPTKDRLRSEAIQDVLARDDPGVLVQLLRETARGEATRRVHDRLADAVDEIHRLHRQLAPDADEPWSPFSEAGGSPPDSPAPGGSGRTVPERAGGTARSPADRAGHEQARVELARRLAAVEPPRNSSGSPNRPWVDALERAANALREGDWEELWTKGPGGKYLAGEDTYSGKAFPPEVDALLEEARRLTVAERGPELSAQAGALGRLARHYDRALAARQREAGAYRFEDVTHHLRAASDPVAGRSDLYHRLDRRTRHVLLDEFQDTSPAQWEALRPMVDRLARGSGQEGATVVVADPKQSIYEWRDADPALVDRVRQSYGLAERSLDQSWRSTRPVLDFVNRLFGDLSRNPVVAELDHGPEVSREWTASFDEHRPAEPLRDLPGHVRVEVGPRDEGRGSHRPLLLARAAERVKELRAAAPGASIGVLTRRNRTVARLIHELRRRGIDASEEGGTPVDDAAPVAAVLALLRLADHPGDGIARYHVASTPLGRTLEYVDHRDREGARRLATRVRRRLLRDGYGSTLAAWTRGLVDHVSRGELRRLEQLIELGFRWEQHAGLRPAEFARLAASERMLDPRETAVRVMTGHQAKGLEFDVVLLPELEDSLTAGGGSPTVLPERDPDTGYVRRVFPYVKKGMRPLFPELEEAARQRAASRLRDEMSWLYVTVTRARYALHLLLAADPPRGPGRAKTHARVVRAALDRESDPIRDGEVLHESGEPGWHRRVEGMAAPDSGAEEPASAPEQIRLRVDASRPRSRILPSRSASELERGERVDPAGILRLDRDESIRRGEVVHRWCQATRWIEDGLPDDEILLRLARDTAPEMGPERARRLAARFRSWMDAPAVRRALSREATAERMRAAESIEVETERPFALRTGDQVLTGVIDRLVLVRAGRPGNVLEAEVLDFKTDAVEADDDAALAARSERYASQLGAYRRAVADMYRLDAERVTGRLIFLVPGIVTEP